VRERSHRPQVNVGPGLLQRRRVAVALVTQRVEARGRDQCGRQPGQCVSQQAVKPADLLARSRIAQVLGLEPVHVGFGEQKTSANRSATWSVAVKSVRDRSATAAPAAGPAGFRSRASLRNDRGQVALRAVAAHRQPCRGSLRGRRRVRAPTETPRRHRRPQPVPGAPGPGR